jgi:hypothetical protein
VVNKFYEKKKWKEKIVTERGKGIKEKNIHATVVNGYLYRNLKAVNKKGLITKIR